MSGGGVKRLALALVTLLFLTWSLLFIYRSSFIGIDGKRYFCLFDDAMISMRYAWNLSHGLGLVWNPGERVEGFTNLLMTLYMTLGTTVFDKNMAVLFVQLSGIVFLLGSAFVNMKIAERVFPHDTGIGLISVLAYVLALSYYPLDYWSLMGMETGLLALLLLSATWLALRFDDKIEFSPALPILSGLAFFTRQDMLIPISLIFLFRMFEAIRYRKISIVVKESLMFSAFIVSLEVFRWFYYGDLAPNTYYLKLGSVPLMIRVQKGLLFVGTFLRTGWPAVLFALFGSVIYWDKKSFLLLSLFLSLLAYQIWIGGDAWEYWRMMSPFMPMLFIASLRGIFKLAESTTRILKTSFSGRRVSFSSATRTLALCAVCILLLSANAKFLKEMLLVKEAYNVKENHDNVNTALAIKEVCGENASVAVFWAGAIPYYTGLKSIDILGKSDKYIAHLPPHIKGNKPENFIPGHVKYDFAYSIVACRPTCVSVDTPIDVYLSSFMKQHYEKIVHKGIAMWLDKDAEGISWS